MHHRWALALRVAFVAAVVLTVVTSATAQEGPRGAIGVTAGIGLPDGDLVGDANNTDLGPVFGAKGSYQFSDNWAWFADVNWSEFESAIGMDPSVLAGRTGFERRFAYKTSGWHWFWNVGLGKMDVDLGSAAADFDRTLMSFGFGTRKYVDDKGFFHWELRADRASEESPINFDVNHITATVGWSWGLGGEKTDSDGDGVSDGRDKCPGTPKGALVDSKGCPLDGDGDGVADGLDRCPDTPAGWPVDSSGCPRDSDGDGVPDGKDKCPDTPRGATVNADGCPSDDDKDGVYNGIDKCPNTPAGTAVDATGCPKDSDGDGVTDDKDRCPNTPRGAKVDANGCPSDDDGDGVPNGVDRCPGTPKGATVDASGCPKDTDGDGVYDGIDKCPNTPRGAPVDSTGCRVTPDAPAPFEGNQRTLILEGVNFEVNSDKLRGGSTDVLDRVAASLVAWPEVNVEVGGHTDSTGAAAYNEGLSLRRADSVRNYLASKGVDPQRMTVRGYGEDRPIADNGTAEGRRRNRRVELSRTN